MAIVVNLCKWEHRTTILSGITEPIQSFERIILDTSAQSFTRHLKRLTWLLDEKGIVITMKDTGSWAITVPMSHQ